jgi:cytidylate kinase
MNKLMKKIVIAIDGHSSTGKSTVAKQLAHELNYIYVDTGAMYRAITLFAHQHKWIENDVLDQLSLVNKLPDVSISFQLNSSTQKSEVYLNGENVEDQIRDMTISSKVSLVAQVSEVREKLVQIQQEMGEQKGIVMDGRDIGTVVFPDAELKLFMTASAKIRAQRRYDELQRSNSAISYEEVFENVVQRDKLDSEREHSPLKQAEDAVLIDNSNLSQDEQFKLILQLAYERMK